MTQAAAQQGRAPLPPRCRPCGLADLDSLQGESIGLFVWSDVRPLRGVAALIDWRLCGALSQLLLARRFLGAPRETLLYPVRGRFGPRRLFVFGLGSRAACTAAELGAHGQHAALIMQRAGATPITLAAPAAPRALEMEADFVQALRLEPPGGAAQVLVERPAREV
ncbi:MAG: hypothetical protein EON47_10560 [Acetobacteraceae bacterium]|nr:MAG: hypothetical protein EON47_10560 [Acetobacteraceae bacterium]